MAMGDRLNGMCVLHLEVPIHEMAVERTQIDTPGTFLVYFLGTGKLSTVDC